MPPPSLEHCKPPHQLRKGQFVRSGRAEQDSPDSTLIRAANGGQFGLSLGRLLSKGGMMKTGCPALPLSAEQRTPGSPRSEE